MAGYDVFARYYDALTANVDYKGRAAYLRRLLEHLHHEPGIVLDLACGTGSLTLELYKLGMDVYGVDGSIAMLSEAKDKAYDMEADVMFLCQKMQTLDLFGTVNTVFCSLDSINHLSGEAQVQAAFDRVAFFMDNDSWFIFDVNTLYKHEKVLGNNTYIYDLADIYCAWQNRYSPQDIEKLEANIATLEPVTTMLAKGMTVEQMVDTALTGFEVEKLEEIPVHYACTCSREKYYNALATLEPDEIDTLPAVDGKVEAVCPYCCRKYYFTKEELHELAESVREKRKNVSK